MNAQAIEIAAFARTIAPPLLALIELTTANTDVVTAGNRTTIHDIVLVGIARLGAHAHHMPQRLPEGVGKGVQPAIEPTFGEHRGNVAMFFEKHAAEFLVSREKGGGHQSRGHDFRCAHLGLRIVFLAVGG